MLPFGCNGTLHDYEEYKFAQHALKLIQDHDASSPLFLNYDFHVAHEPIELPRNYFEKQQVFTDKSGVADYDHRRTTYQGMVNFMDEAIANVTKQLQQKLMWTNTLYILSSDNGGPSFAGSHHLAANNFPLRGSKATDLEGGIRVVGFVAGGLIAKVVPRMVGTQLDGIIHIADWYATLCTLAGVDPEDGTAAAAGVSIRGVLTLLSNESTVCIVLRRVL